MFVDPHIGLSLGCFLNTYGQAIKFKHEPTEKAASIAAKMSALKRCVISDDELGDLIGVEAPRKKKRKETKAKPEKKGSKPTGLFSKMKKLK
jgi:hypothetical protein